MTRDLAQPLILAPGKPYGLSTTYRLLPEKDPRDTLAKLAQAFDPGNGVFGVGEPLARTLGKTIPGLRTFPALSGANCAAPSTQSALWILLAGDDRGLIFDQDQRLQGVLAEAFHPEDRVDTFTYAGGRDLSGYEDGTENPDAEKSPGVALVDAEDGLEGSSFVSVSRWVHDLAHFRTHSQDERDHIIGRRQETNEELANAKPSAHVRRSAQETFTPAAFMLRRSMPWATNFEQGLEFIAYGKSFAAFESVLRRMMGFEDGIVDALFTFSRPVRGGYYWCPPIFQGHLDLKMLA